MVTSRAVKRGEVWLVNLDPTVGAEIQKARPCLIVSPDELNSQLRTVIIVPMTTEGFEAPFRVPVTFQTKHGLLLADQIRAVDKARLLEYKGAVKTVVLHKVLAVLQQMFTP